MMYIIIILISMAILGISNTFYFIGVLLLTYLFFSFLGYFFSFLPVIVLISFIYMIKRGKRKNNFFEWKFRDDFTENQERYNYYKQQNQYKSNFNFTENKSKYYSILGVSETASLEEIKKKYKSLAKKYHPDLHASKTEIEQKENEQKFKEINDAYSYMKKIKK